MSKRLSILHKVALSVFLFRLGLYFLNETFLKIKIPGQLIGYLIFLSLGFYVGFHLCLSELRRSNRK